MLICLWNANCIVMQFKFYFKFASFELNIRISLFTTKIDKKYNFNEANFPALL